MWGVLCRSHGLEVAGLGQQMPNFRHRVRLFPDDVGLRAVRAWEPSTRVGDASGEFGVAGCSPRNWMKRYTNSQDGVKMLAYYPKKERRKYPCLS